MLTFLCCYYFTTQRAYYCDLHCFTSSDVDVIVCRDEQGGSHGAVRSTTALHGYPAAG